MIDRVVLSSFLFFSFFFVTLEGAAPKNILLSTLVTKKLASWASRNSGCPKRSRAFKRTGLDLKSGQV